METHLMPRAFNDFADLRLRFDRMFEDLIGRPDLGAWIPPLDIRQTDHALELRFDVPGFEPDDVKIRVTDGVLTVEGEHAEEREEAAEAGYLRRERRRGSFYRSLRLPGEADAEHIDAVVKNGVAEITVPLQEEPESAIIEVEAKAG